MNLNELAAKVRKANEAWWTDIHTGQPIPRNKGELLMMVITELAEAVEGIRKKLMDDKLPHRRMEEVEMADAYIRLLDFAGEFKLALKEFQFIDPIPLNKPEGLLSISIEIGNVYLADRITSPTDGSVSIVLQLIREYCSVHQLDLNGAMHEKLAYNATRHDHTHEARKADGGKKF